MKSYSPWYRDTRAAWDRDVESWLAEVGSSRGLGKVQSITTLKERPWSVVRRVTFHKGVSYFKACSEAGKHEPALHLFLEENTGFPIPQSQAVDLHKHWMLTADAGAPLREALAEADQLHAFARLLRPYAEMQILSLSQVERLLDIGLPDRRLGCLPRLLEELLSAGADIAGQSPETWNALCAAAGRRLPLLEQVCADLDGSNYSAALDHGDLHQGNVLVGGAEVRLSDWGDACITHPFSSLIVTLETVTGANGADHKPASDNYLRDAYLEPWTAFSPRRQLLCEFRRALWLGRLIRVLNCALMFRAAPEKALRPWRPHIFEQLQMWVNHDAL